jgi:hypothetical protein
MRLRIRDTIEALVQEELDAALGAQSQCARVRSARVPHDIFATSSWTAGIRRCASAAAVNASRCS